MTKEEILNKLKSVKFDKDKFIVILGASMVAQGIKDKTSDIDIAVSNDYFNELKKIADSTYIYNDTEILVYKDIEIGKKFYYEDSCVIIDEIRFLNIDRIYDIKKLFYREKDKKDIHLLEMFLASSDNHFLENKLYSEGYQYICGVDEVGRGPLIGPVVTAAVILPRNFVLEGLTDSKKLSEKKRNYYNEIIRKEAISYGIGVIDNKIIDDVNIYEATKLAMKQALDKLNIMPDYVLIDAMKLEIDIPSYSFIKGDFKSISIAAASVVAKVERDKMMYELDEKYPYYNFKNNKGYPTKDHIEAINEYGILDLHRKSYGPVKDYLINHR